MNKLTFKDYILHSKCLNCDSSSNITLIAKDLITKSIHNLKVNLNKTYCEINLKITYKNNLNLRIYYKNNKLETNNLKDLTDYLNNYTLRLSSGCEACSNKIYTKNISFDFKSLFLLPLELMLESIHITSNNKMYILISNYEKKASYLTINKITKQGHQVFTDSILKLELPLIKKNSFKSKKHFIDKMNKYVTFS